MNFNPPADIGNRDYKVTYRVLWSKQEYTTTVRNVSTLMSACNALIAEQTNQIEILSIERVK